jgi:hypothetical protein
MRREKEGTEKRRDGKKKGREKEGTGKKRDGKE